MRRHPSLILLLAVFCNVVFAQNTDPNQYWQEHFVSKMKQNKGLSYKLVERIKFRNIDTTLAFVSDELCYEYEFNITQNSIESRLGDGYAIITKDSMKIINFPMHALSFGAIKPDTMNPMFDNLYQPFGSILWPKYNADLNKYAPFYLFPDKERHYGIDISSSSDTIIGEKAYKVLHCIKLTSYTIVNDTSPWIPDYDTILYFCNKTTNLIDKITAYAQDRIFYYDFRDLSTKSKNTNTSKTFDFNAPIYKDYEKYNFNLKLVPPSLSSIGWPDPDYHHDSIMNDRLKNFTIRNIADETFCLKELNGWILLDLWTFGCKPCMEFHKKLQTEKDSLGFRILEKEGISIVCLLQTTSEHIPWFKTYANRFSCNDIMYYTSGNHTDFSKLFNVIRYPKYFLYAPDGHLVFEGFINAGNYSPLLKAKAEYEKRNNLKP